MAGGTLRVVANGMNLDAENPGSLPQATLDEGDRAAWGFNVRSGAIKDVQQGQLSFASGTINCDTYYEYDSTTGYHVMRTDAPDICTYPIPLDAGLGHFTFDDNYLYNSGTLTGTTTSGVFSEYVDYRVESSGERARHRSITARASTARFWSTSSPQTMRHTVGGRLSRFASSSMTACRSAS